MRRVLAVLGAAAMIVASLAIRARIDADDNTDGATPAPSGEVRITCATEVAAACEALGDGVIPTIEPAGTTADRLADVTPGEDPGMDGWLVPAPWPDLVNERRRSRSLDPLLDVEGPVLARSRLGLAVAKTRASTLQSKCAGPITWKCLGAAAADGYWASAGRPEWGAIKPGHAEPDTDAVGLLVLGQAVSSYFNGRTDLSNIDLDASDDFQRWFSALERQVPVPQPGDTPLNRMLVTNGAAYDAVGATEAELQTRVPANDTRVDLLYPEPMATADIVLATAGTSNARAARRVAGGETTRKALTSERWAPANAAALPPTNGLPSAGLLLQLQNRWHGVTGR